MSEKLVYRGSNKHKNRPANGRKGTICPDWTHGQLGADAAMHNWPGTEAERLFLASVPAPDGSAQRYTTGRGIAFCAQQSNDGTWHGYPVPWQDVPDELTDKWLEDGLVQRKQRKRYMFRSKDDIWWALESDDE